MIRNDDTGEVTQLAEVENEFVAGNPLLMPHQRRWTERAFLNACPNLARTYHQDAYLRWKTMKNVQERTPYDYFTLMFPQDNIKETITFTNENLEKLGNQELTRGEYEKWLGIRLAMAIEPRKGSLPVYWESSTRDRSILTILTAPSYGERFYMRRHRFEDITSALAFNAHRDAIDVNEVGLVSNGHKYCINHDLFMFFL